MGCPDVLAALKSNRGVENYTNKPTIPQRNTKNNTSTNRHKINIPLTT